MTAVSPSHTSFEIYRRADGEWTCETGGPGGRVTIHGVLIGVDAVYE